MNKINILLLVILITSLFITLANCDNKNKNKKDNSKEIEIQSHSESDRNSDSNSNSDSDDENEGNQQKYRSSFVQWTRKYNKTYTSEEYQYRFKQFKENSKYIKKYNKHNKNPSMNLDVNQFSDLSHEEFQHTYLSVLNVTELNEELFINNNSSSDNSTHKLEARWTRPSSIDWRTWGMVNKVKNQGGCGSCYTFASVAALESHYFRKYNIMLDLSEQQLVDCTSGYGNGGCSGGWMHNCYRYMMDNGGINQQHNYPYEANVGPCRYRLDDAQARIIYYAMIKQGDEEDLAFVVAAFGPVAIAFDASTREFMNYGSGIYHSENCNAYRTTHAVTIVGYGSEGGIDYWTAKNSWGDDWGENGYFRIRRNVGNKCGVATASSYPVVT